MNTWKKARAAIKARRSGLFDHPSLVALGPIFTAVEIDVLRIKTLCLQAYGFTVGPRDPRLNTDHEGDFMVVEYHQDDELPTRDGANGPWCLVGNDLDTLVTEAFKFWAGER